MRGKPRGTMVTLAAMCNTLGVDIGAAASAELARVWTKIGKIRAKQAAKPTGSALPIASVDIHAKRGDAKQAPSARMGSAVGAAETPNLNPSTREARAAEKAAGNNS
jgi:hypothetical protein